MIQQIIKLLILKLDTIDQQFWIAKSMVAFETAAALTKTTKLPNVSTQELNNQCTSWYWINVELCSALWPLANEWSHEDCHEEKHFICEQMHENGILRHFDHSGKVSSINDRFNCFQKKNC